MGGDENAKAKESEKKFDIESEGVKLGASQFGCF